MSAPILTPAGNLAPSEQPGGWRAAHEAMKHQAPDDMTRADLARLGHGQPILAAVRANCIQCQGGSPAEVRRCTQTWCALWPFRLGTNPLNRRELTAEQRAELAARGRANRAAQMANASMERATVAQSGEARRPDGGEVPPDALEPAART